MMRSLLALLLVAVAPAVASQSATPVAVLTLERQPEFRELRSYVGAVEARQHSRLGFELGGMVAEVRVDEGDAVVAGQTLARLDTARLEARLAESEAAVRQAAADLELAEATLERTEAALEIRGVSRQERDEARQRRSALEATLVRARAAAEAVHVDLGKATLIAPYAGMMVARNVDVGDVVAAGAAALELRQDGTLEARIGVAAADVVGFDRGMPVTVHHAGSAVPATVRSVAAGRALRERTIDVIVELSPGVNARPGDLVRLPVERVRRQPGFRIPVTALAASERGLWSVYAVVGEEPVVERRTVDVLAMDERTAFVQGSITAGERIVATGVQRLVPRQRVRVVERAQAGAAP